VATAQYKKSFDALTAAMWDMKRRYFHVPDVCTTNPQTALDKE
jgi:hypothetical protein